MACIFQEPGVCPIASCITRSIFRSCYHMRPLDRHAGSDRVEAQIQSYQYTLHGRPIVVQGAAPIAPETCLEFIDIAVPLA